MRWGTVGVSDNILEASYQALVDAIRYKLFKDKKRQKRMAKRAAGSAPPLTDARHSTQEAPQRELELTAPAFEPDLCNPTEEHQHAPANGARLHARRHRAAGRRARSLRRR